MPERKHPFNTITGARYGMGGSVVSVGGRRRSCSDRDDHDSEKTRTSETGMKHSELIRRGDDAGDEYGFEGG